MFGYGTPKLPIPDVEEGSTKNRCQTPAKCVRFFKDVNVVSSQDAKEVV